MPGRSERRRLSRGNGPKRGLPLDIVLPAVVALLLGLVSFVALNWVRQGPAGPPAAVIIDQLGATDPGPEFVSEATDLLAGAGYTVDYYDPRVVTVELYQKFQRRGYDLIILRTHAAPLLSENGVALFTNEPSTPDRALREPLAWVSYNQGGAKLNGIPPEFISSFMEGSFDGTTVVMMGCNTLTGPGTANAFLSRGATSVFGWDGSVSSVHTDESTLMLLRHLVTEGKTPEEARQAMDSHLRHDYLYGGDLQLLSARSGD